MPLAMANQGMDFTIKNVNGSESVKHHLETLGFVTGAIVSVITEINGNVIVNIKNSRIAISKSMATKIIV